MPKISVILPVYNGEKYLKEAIESVLGQTYADFECLVIDDGSTDVSADIIKCYSDPRLIYIHKDHSGLIDTLNLGLNESKGELIARFDSDDLCEPDRFEEQIKYFEENPECMLAGSYAIEIDKDSIVTGMLDYVPTDARSIRKYSILHNPFIHPSVMMRKSIFNSTDGYRNSFLHSEDYELWTRVIYKNICANIPKRLIRYRMHGNQVTRRNNITMRFWGISVRVLALFRYVSSFRG
jgi:glycosyltransferase involved in cell wall biosynthesis